MTHCTRCEKDVRPIGVLSTSGVVEEECPACHLSFVGVVAKPAAPTSKPTAKPTRPIDHVAALQARLDAVTASIPSAAELKAMRAERRGLVRALAALGVKQELKN